MAMSLTPYSLNAPVILSINGIATIVVDGPLEYDSTSEPAFRLLRRHPQSLPDALQTSFKIRLPRRNPVVKIHFDVTGIDTRALRQLRMKGLRVSHRNYRAACVRSARSLA